MNAQNLTSRGRWTLAGACAVAAAAAGYTSVAPRAALDLPTVEVSRGEFVDRLELRGEIRPLKSIVLTAPTQAGELQIVRLLRSGTAVAPGDVIVQFDATNLRRTVQEKESELKQAEAEIEQARAQSRSLHEQNETALLKARYDVERARLDLGDELFVARLDHERARLALADAEQRLREAEQKAEADRAAARADVSSRERRRDKVRDDLARAARSLAALEVRAPGAGTIHILNNARAGGPFGSMQEFREGDRAWAGAPIAELPDLSAVLFVAQFDEAERGRLRPRQPAVVRVDAIPDREFRATLADISVLARVDFSSGWPPQRNFDLRLRLDDADARLRPGMSATARVAVDQLADVLRVPAEAVFVVGGQPLVYRLAGSAFESVRIEIARRTREQVVVAGGVSAGDRLATRRPSDDQLADPR